MPSVYVIEQDTAQEDFARMLEGLEADWEAFTSENKGREWAETGVTIAEDAMRDGFAQSKAPNGTAWAPNAPATIKKKGHGLVLRDKGRLGVSLTQETHPDAVVEIVVEPAGCGFTRGTAVEYSGFNQKDRPHVGFTEDAVNELTELGADLAIEHLKAGA